MRHPNGPIPVSVVAVVRSGLIHGGHSYGGPKVSVGHQVPANRIHLGSGTHTSQQRRDPINPHVEVYAAAIAQDAGWTTLGVVHHVAEIPGLLIPCVVLQSVHPDGNVGFVSQNIISVPERKCGHPQYLGCPNRVGGIGNRRDTACELFGMNVLLRRIIVPAPSVVKVIPSGDQLRGQPAGGRTPQPASEKEMHLLQAGIKVFKQRPRLRAVPDFLEKVDLNR